MSTTDLDKSIAVANGRTRFAADTLPEGALADLLNAFNGGRPLELIDAVKAGSPDGVTVSGVGEFMGVANAQITVSFKSNADCSIQVEFTKAQLSGLIHSGSASLGLPNGFDVILPRTWGLIEKTGNDLTFRAVGDMGQQGQLALIVEKHVQWDAAVGLDLNVPGLAALPGFKGNPVAVFDSFVGLSDIMLVVSSMNESHFNFPDLSQFNLPNNIGNKQVKLPKQADGLVSGLNVYASVSTAKNRGFQILARYLRLKLDGTVGITVSISLPDPQSNSKLFLSFNEEIQKGWMLIGELGCLLKGGMAGVFLEGQLKTQIQGQPVLFVVQAVAVENGVLISGSMENRTPITFEIDRMRFGIANLGLVIGIDNEDIPSVGFAATIDAGRVNGSLALFIDSVNPAQSMFAAALSDLTLLDVIEALAGQKDIPPEMRDTFGRIGLKGLQSFTLPQSLASALDNRNIPIVVQAFAAHGTHLPSKSDQLMLDVNRAGSLWYLTDMATMTHYILRHEHGTISVSLEPQLYCAPQATQIGSLQFPQGFHLEAEVDLIALRAQLTIEIKGLTGISAEADLRSYHPHQPRLCRYHQRKRHQGSTIVFVYFHAKQLAG